MNKQDIEDIVYNYLTTTYNGSGRKRRLLAEDALKAHEMSQYVELWIQDVSDDYDYVQKVLRGLNFVDWDEMRVRLENFMMEYVYEY